MAVSQSNQRAAVPMSLPSTNCPKTAGSADSPLLCNIRHARLLHIEEIPDSTFEKYDSGGRSPRANKRAFVGHLRNAENMAAVTILLDSMATDRAKILSAQYRLYGLD